MAICATIDAQQYLQADQSGDPNTCAYVLMSSQEVKDISPSLIPDLTVADALTLAGAIFALWGIAGVLRLMIQGTKSQTSEE